MRNLLLVLGLGLVLSSCEKEALYDCNCGLVVSDRVSDYSVVIRNECSSSEKRFYLERGDWLNAHPGSNFCITNTSQW
tara:strand:+ start:3208 stop:3441 length:234 start_codon:yes stop_codon:yes gene_type:complete